LVFWAMWERVVVLLFDSLWGKRLAAFSVLFSSVWWAVCCMWELWSVVWPEGWLVSNSWSLLPTKQVAIRVCDCSLPGCPSWSVMLLFSPGGRLTEFGSLPHFHSLRLIQHSTLPLLWVIGYIHCLCHSVLLCGGCEICPLYCIMFLGRSVVYGTHLLDLQIYIGRFGTRPVGRNGEQLFPRQMLTGAGSRPARHR
jgi:hypothetical protein